MTVLITGATGLVGQELVSLLLQNGFTVHYLSTSKSKLVSQNNYKGFYWNPKTSEIDLNALTDVEVIVHLAGASVAKKWTSSYKEEIIESRVLSTRLLYKTLQKNSHQVKQIVSASAITVAGALTPRNAPSTFVESGFNGLNNVLRCPSTSSNGAFVVLTVLTDALLSLCKVVNSANKISELDGL